MMKKISCLLVILLVTHGTALSMMHAHKIMKSASRVRLHQRALCTGLKYDVKDATFLKHEYRSDNLMNADDRYWICRAYIDSIYKVAQIEAMCKIKAHPGLDDDQQRQLLNKVPYVVKE